MTVTDPYAIALLDSIKPGMKLNRNFFLKIYGHAYTCQEFRQIALDKLKEAGCSKAEDYYNQVVGEYRKKQDEELQPVARWYREQCEKEFEKIMKRSEKIRTSKETQDLRQKSDKELLILLKELQESGQL